MDCFVKGTCFPKTRTTNSRITNIITNLQDSIDQVDYQFQALPYYFGHAPEKELKSHCEKFVNEITKFLYTSPGEVEREIMAELEKLKTRLCTSRLLFDPQTETYVSEGGN